MPSVTAGLTATRGFFDLASRATCVTELQALVYDIFPSTTAIVDYAIGLEKLSANEQVLDDAQTAVSL